MNLSEDKDNTFEEDCCGSGCNPCILDIRKKLSENTELTPSTNVLDQSNYVKFRISDVKEEAKEYLILKLELKDPVKDDCGIVLKVGQYVIIRIANVSRSFTPILWNRTSFTILVKIYKNGQMSNLMKNKKINDEIDVRGPYGDFFYRRNSYKKIIMFSIGSGIAAMYSIINSIVLDNAEDTRMHLISSFRYFSTIPFKKELRGFCDYWNFSCTLYLTQEKNNHVLSGVTLINNMRLNVNAIEEILKNEQAETTLILICGTKEYNLMIKTVVDKCKFVQTHIFD